MKYTRRRFAGTLTAGSIGSAMLLQGCTNEAGDPVNDARTREIYKALDNERERPVLKVEHLPDPVIIESLDLLRYGDNFICRVVSTDGARGLSVANNTQMLSLYPIFLNRLQPFFPGKDARDWEKLLEEVYVYRSNYKLQSLALWVPLATIEFAVLDMLGRIAGRSLGEMVGEVRSPKIRVYQANNFRGRTAGESIGLIRAQVEETDAKALKIKIGGRMSRNADFPPGRSDELIPLVRKTFGDEMVIYADSNGSYDVDEAIRIGKLLEEYRYDFYEEPVPFDWYRETKRVADALQIRIAGGEQEPSMHNFRWLIGNMALQIVQPDLFYFGGMIRCMRVARMAAVQGMTCTPHISGSGLGYLYMMHFVSTLSNAGPYHEFKGFDRGIRMDAPASSVTSQGGEVTVPTGPGLGVEIDEDFLAKHMPVSG